MQSVKKKKKPPGSPGLAVKINNTSVCCFHFMQQLACMFFLLFLKKFIPHYKQSIDLLSSRVSCITGLLYGPGPSLV